MLRIKCHSQITLKMSALSTNQLCSHNTNLYMRTIQSQEVRVHYQAFTKNFQKNSVHVQEQGQATAHSDEARFSLLHRRARRAAMPGCIIPVCLNFKLIAARKILKLPIDFPLPGLRLTLMPQSFIVNLLTYNTCRCVFH